MLSSGVISIPRRYESFKLLVANFIPSALNGKLSDFVIPGAQGYIVADFVKNRVPSLPHAAFGSINFIDGKVNSVLDIPNALIEIEEGPREGSWHTLASFVAHGYSADGHAYAFRSSGADGDTSLNVDFVMANEAGLRGAIEVASWVLPS